MQNAPEKQWFDADELASMLKTYRRGRAMLGHVDPNQLALSVMNYFRNGITDEDLILSMLTQFAKRQAIRSCCIASMPATVADANRRRASGDASKNV
jgi:hypothetical protein